MVTENSLLSSMEDDPCDVGKPVVDHLNESSSSLDLLCSLKSNGYSEGIERKELSDTSSCNLVDNYLDNTLPHESNLCGTYGQKRFFKGCKWSPDNYANRILTCDGDNKLKVFHTFLNKHDFIHSQVSNEYYELSSIGKIYDFDWFPIISPSQYYVLTATSLGPVHIWDMVNSKSEASYRMFNVKDEAINAHCVTCSGDGQKIYAATSDYIFYFDVNRPGRTYDFISTRQNFRRAIVSSIALNPIRNSMFAIGTYNNRIGIYDETHLLCVLYGHTKGITHLKFSPNGTLLFSGVRGSGEIICWDLRNPGTALYKLIREVKTQQRMYFDLAVNGKYLISGTTSGAVFIWNTSLPPVDDILSPICKFQAHEDCANGISVNTQFPIIATVSGQYHDNESPHLFYDSDDDYESVAYPKIENSLKLWYTKWLQ